MKKQFKYCLLLVLLSACQHVEKAPKPDNLIPEEKMVDILTDMVLIDAAMNYNQTEHKTKALDPGKYIFEKYQVDSVQLAKSNAYYLEDFDRSMRIYEQVRDHLEAKKEKLDSLDKSKDSIRKIQKKPLVLSSSKHDSLVNPSTGLSDKSDSVSISRALFQNEKFSDSLR
ncbi:MAG TPA: DUF4296 domain-containing protein [Flavobacteriaceae bacterium]|nr:DUF4296 domain-containing protein [Flavobacteriaceae bacterium]